MSNEDNEQLRRLLKSEEETRGDIKPIPASTGKDGTTPRFIRPALDKDNMPLPNRVDEIDVDGTRVTNAAYKQTTDQQKPAQQLPNLNQRPAFQNPVNQKNRTYQPPAYTPPPPQTSFWNKFQSIFQGNKGCLLRGLIIAVFAMVVFGLCVGSYFIYQYYAIASTLPEVGDLRNRASQFETTHPDRNGQPLYGSWIHYRTTHLHPDQEYFKFSCVPSQQKTRIYSHPGFDP